jgi:competence protein ComEA
MKSLAFLSVIVVLAGSYKLIRDYYIEPSKPPRAWRVETMDHYQPTMILDLNYAPADSMELVPGIGPVLANRIIEYRTNKGRFQSVDSLTNVAGIGPAKLKQIRKYFRINN